MDSSQHYEISDNNGVAPGECHWSEITDPKEKKRIQNRNAQRVYRQRVKARLKALESTVKNQQAAFQQHARNMNDGLGTDPSSIVVAQNGHRGLSPSPRCAPTPNKPYGGTTVQPRALQLNNGDNNSMDASNTGRRHTEIGQARPSPQAPSVRSMDRYPINPNLNVKPSDKMFMDYMRTTSKDTVSNDVQGHLQPPNQHQSTHQQQQQQQQQQHQQQQQQQLNAATNLYAAEHSDIMNFSSAIDCWPEDMMQPSRRAPAHAAANRMDMMNHNFFPDVQRANVASAMSTNNNNGEAPGMNGNSGKNNVAHGHESMGKSHPTSMPGSPPQTDHSDSSANGGSHDGGNGVKGVNECFELTLQYGQAMGFETFDALVIAYYTEKFDGGSPLANEQRLSRNRGLPKLIKEVYQATLEWSDWERRGFQEEVLRTTETVLQSESERARHALNTGLMPLLRSQDWATTPANPQTILAMKKVIEDELPELWALLMALSAEDRDVWQRNRSNTVLTAIILLRYGGRMPVNQLIGLLGACL